MKLSEHFWNGFKEGARDAFAIVGLVFFIGFLIVNVTVEDAPPYHITCYSPDLAITYMSIEPVTLPNEYGVWKFASGKGAYIQQSGDTCITQEVVEMPTHNIPE